MLLPGKLDVSTYSTTWYASYTHLNQMMDPWNGLLTTRAASHKPLAALALCVHLAAAAAIPLLAHLLHNVLLAAAAHHTPVTVAHLPAGNTPRTASSAVVRQRSLVEGLYSGPGATAFSY